MKTMNPRSWRMWLLLCILLSVVIIPSAVPVDDLIFACRIRYGSESAKQECYNHLHDAMVQGNPLPHPWWTFSCLLDANDPLTRIGGAKLRYSLAPHDQRVLDILIAKATDADPFVRGAALSELWNMHDQIERTLPVLERALFEDTEETVRRSAFMCLLPLSGRSKEARSLLARAAGQHPIESTHEFARSRLAAWDNKESNQAAEGIGAGAPQPHR